MITAGLERGSKPPHFKAQASLLAASLRTPRLEIKVSIFGFFDAPQPIFDFCLQRCVLELRQFLLNQFFSGTARFRRRIINQVFCQLKRAFCQTGSARLLSPMLSITRSTVCQSPARSAARTHHSRWKSLTATTPAC